MKKNLIIIMIDGGRLDFAQKSTTFEKLKEKSCFLSQSVTYAPHTIAAMHAMFSGSYGSRTGTNSYWSTNKFKKNEFKTLTEYLHENEYYTYADVLNKLIVPKQGFDEFIVHDEDNDDLILRHKEILEKTKKTCVKNNYFIYLHCSTIHTGIKNEVLNVYDNFSREFFDNVKLNENRYKRLFTETEIYLESILEEIKKLKMDEDAMILVMSDHGVSTGEKFGEHAYAAFCYDYTLRTFTYFLTSDLPVIEIKNQTRTIDFMPTILEYLKIPLDDNFSHVDGVSLLPYIHGNLLPENYAFTETGNPLQEKTPPKEPNVKSVRTSKWKLIYNEHNDTKELYGLEKDPNENKNLIGTGLEIENTLWEKLVQIMNTRN